MWSNSHFLFCFNLLHINRSAINSRSLHRLIQAVLIVGKCQMLARSPLIDRSSA